MAHCPHKCGCSDCKNNKSRFNNGAETGYCKEDGKIIEFWGEDSCPIENHIEQNKNLNYTK